VNTIRNHPPADYRHRPERKIVRLGLLDKLANRLKGRLEHTDSRHKQRQNRFLNSVAGQALTLESASEETLLSEARRLGHSLRHQGFDDEPVARLFAIIRELSGCALGMKHFDSQLIGGWILLQGRVAEMQTGEGKTFTAVLPVITAALAGLPVHVITVNDYLTERDAMEMQPLYQRFGLSLGMITHAANPAQRRQAYSCDIVYVTGKELVFDYLRDRMKLSQTHPLRLQIESLKSTRLERKLQLRGLHFALVDEVDSVLIDESRTPLIISGTQANEDEEYFIETGYALSFELVEESDFTIDRDRRRIDLTEGGCETLRRLSANLGSLFKGAIRREEIVHKALLARYIYTADEDYLVREGKIELIDQLSGRVMEGRSWERGLHQMVELKESCELTKQRVTLARISYQNFFRRYLHLCGMTGTAWEVRKEIWNVYGLAVSPVPPHKVSQRKTLPTRVFSTDEQRWVAVIERCKTLVGEGRAVLIGTDSVASSERASNYLHQAGVTHQVLSAKQDKDEAQVVSRAAEPGRVTVSTHMAGRGTDIKLHPLVEEAGGLHVILTALYESARVDRQLAGRCGRMGDPGSFEMIITVEDQSIRTIKAKGLLVTAQSLGINSAAGQRMAINALQTEQQFTERQNFLARQTTLEYDLKQNELLAFSGGAD
jgi:preprotein translocase subunit SecA